MEFCSWDGFLTESVVKGLRPNGPGDLDSFVADLRVRDRFLGSAGVLGSYVDPMLEGGLLREVSRERVPEGILFLTIRLTLTKRVRPRESGLSSTVSLITVVVIISSSSTVDVEGITGGVEGITGGVGKFVGGV